MRKEIHFVVPDTNELTEKIMGFFRQFDFTLIEHKDNHLMFRHSSTLLDAWKTNPLNWGSEISVSISDRTIFADFNVNTDAQMNTKEEEKVWQTFIDHFQACLTNQTVPNSTLNSSITENKKSRISYIGWAFLGALTGGFLSLIYNQITNSNSKFSLFLIPILATTFLAWRISYKKSKAAL